MNNINKLRDLINELPGIGKKTSTRLAIKLIEQKKSTKKTLENILNIIDEYEIDDETDLIINLNYKKSKNNKKLLIIQNNFDLQSYLSFINNEIDYFNLNINSISDITRSLDEHEKISKLINYIEKYNIEEIIFGLSPKKESDIIERIIINEILKVNNNIKISKIATGIPFGASIEYIDGNTIRKAIEKREKI